MLEVWNHQLSQSGETGMGSGFVGKKLVCRNCGYQSVVKPGMPVDTQHTDKYGVVIGASFRCAKCGQGIFVWAD
jgi:DNA-directed RNA polymerase subunit RPC12/RpoP